MITTIQTEYSERERHGEHNDCTVRALAAATGMTYTEALALAAKAGRRHRQGMPSAVLMRFLSNVPGYTVKELPVRPPSLKTSYSYPENGYGYKRARTVRVGESVARFIARLPKKGTFYLCSTRHAFAYVDGTVRDMGRVQSRAKMKLAYEITKAQPVEVKSEIAQSDIAAMWERLNKIEEKL